jgi:subtilisin-like proprotein convertase family protein
MNGVVALVLVAGLGVLGSATHAIAEQPGIRCVQNELNALGFNSGRPDGTIGPRTRQASEDYRAWMAGGAGGDGWSQPALTALNGQFWCERVAKAHPEVAGFVTPASEPTQYTSSGATGLVATFEVPIAGRITGWQLHFTFKTECENDHYLSITSPTGRKMVLMDRGLGRCTGTPSVYTSDNSDPGPFLGTRANGKWQLVFKDLDANFHSGALETVQMKVTVSNGGATSEHTVKLDGLPRQAPNPS